MTSITISPTPATTATVPQRKRRSVSPVMGGAEMTFPDPPVPSSCKVMDGDAESSPFSSLLSSLLFFAGGFSIVS